MTQKLVITSMLLLTGSLAPATWAQPANDDCVAAIEVFDGSETLGSTADATGVATSGCSVDDLYDVWYSYTPSMDKFTTFSLCGSTFDTSIAIFEGCGGTRVACNDDSSQCGIRSIAQCVPVTGGQTYLIRVAGFLESRGDYTLTLSECTIPDNDACANAIPIDKDVQVHGTTFASSGSTLSGCSQNDFNDVWYSYTPTADEEVALSLCGSAFDTTLSIFDSCGGAALACNDDHPSCPYPGHASRVGSFSMLQGLTYFLRVAGYGGARGDLSLLLTDNIPPVVTSIVPANVGPTEQDSLFFYVYFDREIQGFDALADLVVTANGVTYAGVNIAPSDDAYDVEFYGIDGNGEISIAVSTASNVRGLSEIPLASSVTSPTVTIDNVAPVVSGLSVSPATATVGETVQIDFNVDEAPDELSVWVNGREATSEKSAYSYTYTIGEYDDEGPAEIEVLAYDFAGNLAYVTSSSQLTVTSSVEMPVSGWPVAAALALAGAWGARKKRR